jgi:ectoine hydroxylase-related dioxygenase (phytanoyl-CoA dioxygenase family)
MQFEQNYLSPFGGFWTDTRGSANFLSRLHAEANLTPEEDRLLRFWIENGYAIIPAALGADDVARTQAAIDRLIDTGAREMTYWDASGKHQHAATRGKLDAPECKVIDVHASDPDVQRAIFAPKIARFLELVMQAKAIAFQTLYFEYGSQQGFHQDTAFVYVEPPLEFIASWIALEDVIPGCGELQFYAGSHRLPDALFGEPPGKALYANDPKAATYSSELEARCKNAQMQHERFLPNAGDVLFWAADLVHGGAPRAGTRTRRSLVTHYCPIGRRPPYAASGRMPQVVVDGHAVMSAT